LREDVRAAGGARGGRHRDARSVTRTPGTPRILMASDRAAWILSPIGAKKHAAPPRGPIPCAVLPEKVTSRASRGGLSLPGSPRGGRDGRSPTAGVPSPRPPLTLEPRPAY